MDSVPAFNQSGCPWAQYELGRLLTCEERLCAWVRQPMNTYSNLGLFLVAILLYSRGTRVGNRTLRDFGILAAVIGVSSTLGHASQIRALVFLDYAAQFILFSYLISLNLPRVFEKTRSWATESRWKMTAVLSAVFIFPSILDKRAGVITFVLMASLYLASEFLGYLRNPAKSYSSLKASLGVFAVAAVCFGLDASEVICYPTKHLFQLHAIWHALVAGSLYLLARHFAQFSAESTFISVSAKRL